MEQLPKNSHAATKKRGSLRRRRRRALQKPLFNSGMYGTNIVLALSNPHEPSARLPAGRLGPSNAAGAFYFQPIVQYLESRLAGL